MLFLSTKIYSPSNMLQLVCLVLVFVFVNAEELVINSTATCGDNYTLDSDVESVYIRYTGGLSTDRCETEFTIASVNDHIICVQPISLNLDCKTRIEYQRYFVAKYVHDGLLTCDLNHLNTYNESCAEGVATFFIVFINGSSHAMTNDTADIRVYAKTRGTGTSDSSSSSRFRFNYAWLSAIPGIFIVMISAGVCVWRRRVQQRKCTTTTRQANTGYPQAMVAGYTVQQSVGDHHAYPTVVAYQRSPAPGTYNDQYAHPSPVTHGVNPSDTAPPLDVKTGPPLTYNL